MRLLSAAKSENHRDWLLIATAYLYALRSSEVVGLTPANIGTERIKLPRKKRSNPVDEKLHEDANPLLNVRQPLLELARKANRKQRLFPISTRTFQRRMHYYGSLAGLPDDFCHPHTLKHSIITELAEKLPVIHIKKRSGHKSLRSLEVYTHPKISVSDRLVEEALKG